MITSGTVVSFLFSFLGYLLVQRVNVRFGISDFVLVLFSSSFLSMLGELVIMPMLSLACILCPKNLEGTVYSLFMSALNFGSILSGLNGSILTTWFGITSKDYHNLDKLILVSNIMTLLPLPMLIFIDNSYFHPDKKENLSEINTNNENGMIEFDFIETKEDKIENKQICIKN
jgi:MFS family permease